MNRFRFRLETVLKVRVAREEEKKRELAVTMTLLREEEAKLEHLLASLAELDRVRAEQSAGRLSPRQLQQQLSFSRYVQRNIDEQRKKVLEAGSAADRKRLEVAEAMRKRKILERLKERRRGEYDSTVAHHEQSQLDEAAIQRFNENKRISSSAASAE